MKNRQIVLSFIAIVATIAIVFSACRKINDATALGGDLIPPVDNITTFDTIVEVQAFNDTFGLLTDSQYLARSEEHFLGLINNDPFFGKTDARIFLELKPTTYGVYPFARKDSVNIDSIVLVLSYLETYGDTNTAQSVRVYELDNTNNFTSDSAYLIRKENFTYNTGFPLNHQGIPHTFFPRSLNDTVKAFRDTTINQLRIKLDTNFARRLFNYDTSNAYRGDSAFKANFKGFAVRSETTGNAVVGIDMAGSKLAIYYNHPKVNGAGVRDTTVNYFFFTALSAAAQYVKRDYGGSPAEASLNNGTIPDPILFIQNSPGTFATIKIPGLDNVSNRLVHRAELIVEQLYDISDSTFTAPEALYLDAFDPTITSNIKFRTIPYDFDYNIASGFPFAYFGIIPQTANDGLGNRVRVWKFNISRYVQHILTRTSTSYDLRLYAPFTIRGKTRVSGSTGDSNIPITGINPTIVQGRLRAIGNTGPGDTNPRRMRLRIIYSKL